VTDLAHKLVSLVITGALVAFVGWLGVTVRRRRMARAEAVAPSPVEDYAQALLRQAQQADQVRDQLAAQGESAQALAQARMAVDRWGQLAKTRPGRFRAERQAALRGLGNLLAQAGQTDEAERVHAEAARAL
jgi:hypothetical protein